MKEGWKEEKKERKKERKKEKEKIPARVLKSIFKENNSVLMSCHNCVLKLIPLEHPE